MAKNNETTIRSHSQERKWLLSIGNGNIIKGVQTLIKKSRTK